MSPETLAPLLQAAHIALSVTALAVLAVFALHAGLRGR